MNILRLVAALRKNASLGFAALLDRRVPRRLKIIAIAATIFIISPLNILGDIPLLGILDDGALISLVLMWFVRASTPYTNTFEQSAIVRR